MGTCKKIHSRPWDRGNRERSNAAKSCKGEKEHRWANVSASRRENGAMNWGKSMWKEVRTQKRVRSPAVMLSSSIDGNAPKLAWFLSRVEWNRNASCNVPDATGITNFSRIYTLGGQCRLSFQIVAYNTKIYIVSCTGNRRCSRSSQSNLKTFTTGVWIWCIFDVYLTKNININKWIKYENIC